MKFERRAAAIPDDVIAVARTDYKATLALPRTDFPMKANLPQREPEILRRWDELGLQALLRGARKDAPLWVLHDGPPYANGRVHLGTALNKILKDFIVRSRSMLGFRTPFVPGWDCHGMPIEHQVARDLGGLARTLPKLELRRLCREYAAKWIEVQRAEFRRLGVMGDWENPYLTYAPEYDAAEIGVLRKFVEQGYVYRGLRPVHWCFGCSTALAEAEVEYREHETPSIYVAFALNRNLPDADGLAAEPGGGAELATAHRAGKLFAVIWTTTPWTLPANLGICLNETFDYVALKAGPACYIVAARLAGEVERACGLKVEKRVALSRAALRALDGRDIFRHPLAPRDVKLMYAEHVTADAGAGLVHTAPGHGYEDFMAGRAYGLKPFTPVDDAGAFTKEGGEWAGMNVFAANAPIIRRLAALGALLHAETLTHSYPHCWRCKRPLIFRATEQWFLRIDHQELRRRVIRAIDRVRWVPPWARDRIRHATETRPDWCLSRQRAWGVPIPALRCAACGRVDLDCATMRRVEEIFAREGSDAWFIRPAEDFAAPGYRCPGCGEASFSKEEDVLDVWFDSGCSQAAVLGRRPELKWPADAYLEAVEQARGWFQSSLICAVAERGAAPFENVISHGLALDERGRKMSKSLGNSEDAAAVVNRLGADVIRLVYASLDYSADLNLGETVYGSVAEAYRKFRNTCRYLLGNLADFDPARDAVDLDAMLEFDRFILARAEKLKTAVRRAYENYDFQAACHALLNFAVVDLSSLYIDVARDRLYCAGARSRERRSAQSALFMVLDAMVRMLAPLVPYTAEEVYSHMPGEKAPSVHLLTFAAPRPEWADEALDARWERLLELRSEALKLLEAMRRAGEIGAPLEAALALAVDGEWSRSVSRSGSGSWSGSVSGAALDRDLQLLKELFIVSDVAVMAPSEAARLRELAGGRGDFVFDGTFARIAPELSLIVAGRRAPGRKCQRCWAYYDGGADPELCPRCDGVVHG